ncbi:MAG: GYD domain-containing protein [Roseiarcus sp.]|jgi:uncharacterized protein with GYD domain
MATYITLATFSDQGLRNVKDTVKRADDFKKAAQQAGVTVKEFLWTQGHYDLMVIVDAPDEASYSALLLSVARMGNVRLQSLRAFTAAEMEGILDKVI